MSKKPYETKYAAAYEAIEKRVKATPIGEPITIPTMGFALRAAGYLDVNVPGPASMGRMLNELVDEGILSHVPKSPIWIRCEKPQAKPKNGEATNHMLEHAVKNLREDWVRMGNILDTLNRRMNGFEQRLNEHEQDSERAKARVTDAMGRFDRVIAKLGGE